MLAELQIFSWVMVKRRLDSLCWRCLVGWSSWVRSVELMVSVMAGLMLDRRLVMRYAARGRGKVACFGGGMDKGC